MLRYLQGRDPEAARAARRRYACFDHVGDDGESYGFAAHRGIVESCESEVVAQLVDVLARAERDVPSDGAEAEEAWFQAAQNARVVKAAEAYYRTMYRGGIASWNLRDTHMAETLDELLAFLDRRVGRSTLSL